MSMAVSCRINTLWAAIFLLAMMGCPLGPASERIAPEHVYKRGSLAEKCFIVTLFDKNLGDYFRVMRLSVVVWI